jgi:hypothetical protein
MFTFYGDGMDLHLRHVHIRISLVILVCVLGGCLIRNSDRVVLFTLAFFIASSCSLWLPWVTELQITDKEVIFRQSFAGLWVHEHKRMDIRWLGSEAAFVGTKQIRGFGGDCLVSNIGFRVSLEAMLRGHDDVVWLFPNNTLSPLGGDVPSAVKRVNQALTAAMEARNRFGDIPPPPRRGRGEAQDALREDFELPQDDISTTVGSDMPSPSSVGQPLENESVTSQAV